MKKSFKILLFAFVLFVLGTTFLNLGQTKVANEKATSQKVQEETAYFKTGFPPTMKEMNEAAINVRKFVWQHWRDKKSGTVTREGINTHGEKYIVIYRIKCAENENCKIFIDMESENVGRGGIKVDKIVEKQNLVAISVDRIANPTDYYLNGKVEVIADNVEKAVNFYYVRLKDKDGGIIHLL